MVSAQLESSLCILSDQADGESHPGSLLENFNINDWKGAAVRSSLGKEAHVMNPNLARNLAACRSVSDRSSLLGCVKIVKHKHDHLPNIHA